MIIFSSNISIFHIWWFATGGLKSAVQHLYSCRLLHSDRYKIFNKIMNIKHNLIMLKVCTCILVRKHWSILIFFRDITNSWEKDAFRSNLLLSRLNSSVNKRKTRSRQLVEHVFCAHNHRVCLFFFEHSAISFFLTDDPATGGLKISILTKCYVSVDCCILNTNFEIP